MGIYSIKFNHVPNRVIFDSDEFQKSIPRGHYENWIKELNGWGGGIDDIKLLRVLHG